MPAGELTTGVDQLKQLIDAQNKLTVSEAAKKLHVSNQIIEDWASLLEEAGEVTIEYHLAKTYIIKKNIVPIDLKKNVNALLLEKREFQDRTGGIINYMDRLEDEIGMLQKILREAVYRKLGKTDLSRLKDTETSHKKSDRELIDSRNGFLTKIEKVNAHLATETKQVKTVFDTLAHDLIVANQLIDLEDKEASMLEANEKKLEDKISKVTKLLDQRMVKLVRNKLPLHSKSKQQLAALKQKTAALRLEFSKDRKDYELVRKECAKRHAAVQSVHQQIIAKLRKGPGILAGMSLAQVQRFLGRRTQIANILTAIENEERSIKRAALKLIGQGDNLPLANQTKFESEIARLNKDLKVIADKRGDLEKQIKTLVTKMN